MFHYPLLFSLRRWKNFSLNENEFPFHPISLALELNLLKLSALRRKKLVKVFSPPLQFTFKKKEKNEKLQKSECCIFEDVGKLTKINV